MTNLGLKETAKKSLMIWTSPGPDINPEEVAAKYIFAREAIDKFLKLEIKPEELIDRLEFAGVGIDDYLDTVEFNCTHNL